MQAHRLSDTVYSCNELEVDPEHVKVSTRCPRLLGHVRVNFTTREGRQAWIFIPLELEHFNVGWFPR